MKDLESDITFFEACQILQKSKRTVSRYVRKGLLKPKKIKSKRGTVEYRFRLVELQNLKVSGKDKIRGDIGGDIRQDIRQDSEVIGLLKETTKVLRDQLIVKDKQIKSLGNKIDGLIERSRETNILIKGLTNKVLMIEDKSKSEIREDREVKDDKKGQGISGFFKRLFRGKVE